jgi:hypothetical protein
MKVDIQKFKKKQCSRCGAPLIDGKRWLCEKCRPITCPIRFDFESDSKELVAQKWKEIKQWYKDHPEAQAPWSEWEDNCRKIWNAKPASYLTNKFFSQKEPAKFPVKTDVFDTNAWTF